MRCFRAISAQLRRNGGELHTGSRVPAIERHGDGWRSRRKAATTYSAAIIVNAAGAWADQIARLAGVAPLRPGAEAPDDHHVRCAAGTDLEHLPFAKTVGDELYFAPESGRLFASPMDEVPSDPCDAQPDEYEVALAAFRMEERTTVKVERIHSRWAGLQDLHAGPSAGRRDLRRCDGFFWLAGQGGFGLQTSPAMARIAASLIFGSALARDRRQCRGAKPRSLLPAAGIGRPTARPPGRTDVAWAPQPKC